MTFRKTAVASVVGLLVFMSLFTMFGYESNGEETAPYSTGEPLPSEEGFYYLTYEDFVKAEIYIKLKEWLGDEPSQDFVDLIYEEVVNPLIQTIIEDPSSYIPAAFSRCIPYIENIDLDHFAIITGADSSPEGTLEIPGKLTPSSDNSDEQLTVYGVFDKAFNEKSTDNAKGITKVTMADTILYLGSSAFENGSIEEISLSKNTLVIRDKCMKGSSIKELTIPESVMFLDTKFVFSCTQLEKITFEGSSAPEVVSDKAFDISSLHEDIHVESPGNWFEGYASNNKDIFEGGEIPEYIVFDNSKPANDDLSLAVAIGIIVIFVAAVGAFIFVMKK